MKECFLCLSLTENMVLVLLNKYNICCLLIFVILKTLSEMRYYLIRNQAVPCKKHYEIE